MPTRRTTLALVAGASAAIFLAQPGFAADPVFSESGVAIKGFDPVAYFTDSAPVAGSGDYQSEWNGATWQFASAENKATFDADPAAYAPQYGGYCAYAVSKGKTAPIDPAAWTIHEDKLYLNFSEEVRNIWREDVPGNISLADANWPGVLN